MTRLAVADNIDTPQGFNLIKLLGVIIDHIGQGTRIWQVRRAEGYGLAINRLNEQLEAQASIRMDVQELASMLSGLDEWFYWLDAVSTDETVSFGIIDSSYMFVDGPPALIEAARRCFEETREI